MFLIAVEIIVFVLIAVLLITQIAVPLFTGTRFFPLFRREEMSSLRDELARVEEENEEQQLREAIAARRIELQKRQVDSRNRFVESVDRRRDDNGTYDQIVDPLNPLSPLSPVSIYNNTDVPTGNDCGSASSDSTPSYDSGGGSYDSGGCDTGSSSD